MAEEKDSDEEDDSDIDRHEAPEDMQAAKTSAK